MDTKDTFWAKKTKEGKYNYIHNIQFPGKYNSLRNTFNIVTFN